MLSLLADLSSQHERLRQLSEDLGGVLSAARATTSEARKLATTASEAPCLSLAPVVCADESHCALIGDSDLPLTPEPTLDKSMLEQWAEDPEDRHAAKRRRSRRSGFGPDHDHLEGLPEGVASGEHPSAQELLEESAERPRVSLHASYYNHHHQHHAHLEDDNAGDARSIHTTVFASRGSCISSASRASSGKTEGDQDYSPQVESSKEMNLVRLNAVLRLQARLGKKKLQGVVTSKEVHKSITALGLIKYAQADVESWLSKLNSICLEQERAAPGGRKSAIGKVMAGLVRSRTASLASDAEDAIDAEGFAACGSVPTKAFVELLLDDEALVGLDSEFQEMTLTIREVLFSGDANRLVAELTNVCVDDVAAPNEKPDLLTLLEPPVGLVILLNGAFIGLRAGDAEHTGIDEGFWINLAFIAFFVMELCLRIFIAGFRDLVAGPARWWNYFDGALIVVSLVDLVIGTFPAGSRVAPLVIIRLLRLLRLTRLVRIFRMHYMKELSLMVRGLLGGLYTLGWALLLLFFTLYMIACLTTSTIGISADPVPEIVRDELFSTVPRSVFTAFRCFLGDCNTSEGKPIVKLLSDKYGLPFVVSYILCMMFVTFGLFNLIVAIYIERTLSAAKTEGEKSKVQRQRESVRIARLTRQLLKKFVAIQRLWGESHNGEAKEVRRIMSAATFADIGGISMPMSKEMFLCLIQDASVQKLMDDLDIPPERAALFDILDADGSGGLEVVELITGLLRVRGETKKSDAVGTLLAVRVVQEMLREQDQRFAELEARMCKDLGLGGQKKPLNLQQARSSMLELKLKWDQQVKSSNGDGTVVLGGAFPEKT